MMIIDDDNNNRKGLKYSGVVVVNPLFLLSRQINITKSIDSYRSFQSPIVFLKPKPFFSKQNLCEWWLWWFEKKVKEKWMKTTMTTARDLKFWIPVIGKPQAWFQSLKKPKPPTQSHTHPLRVNKMNEKYLVLFANSTTIIIIIYLCFFHSFWNSSY